MTSPQRIDAQINTQAAEWLVCLEDTERRPTARQQTEFFAWLRRSPQHLQAFFETAELWRDLEDFDSAHEVDIEAFLARRFGSVVALHDSQAPAASRRPASRRRWLQAAAAVLLTCALSIGGWQLIRDRSVYRTAVSEQRTLQLPDGSVLRLNTASRVKVAYSEQERRIELLAGEALFSVAHEAKRPFLVGTRTATIRAIGTQFNVLEGPGTTTISVVEGKVQVFAQPLPSHGFSTSASLPPPSLLGAGQAIDVAAGRITQKKIHNVAEAVAWQQRRLIFRDASLADVAAEFNRYNEQQIRVAEDIGHSMRLTGIFSADHPQSLILYLQQRRAVQLEQDGSELIISSR